MKLFNLDFEQVTKNNQTATYSTNFGKKKTEEKTASMHVK